MVMTTWDGLRVVLLELEDSGALTAYPDPRSDEGRQPPLEIHLAPWAVEAAQDPHRRFGDDVRLLVGFRRYPEQELSGGMSAPDGVPEMDPTEMSVEIDAPIVVASGHTMRGALRVYNRSAHDIAVLTNGQVTAQVVDPGTGSVVGCFAGAQTAPLVVFPVPPGCTVVVPVLVGTASALPDLGYAIPRGEWAIRAVLELQEGGRAGLQRPTDQVGRRRVRTALLPITVTD
jgi:hypothetical protein